MTKPDLDRVALASKEVLDALPDDATIPMHWLRSVMAAPQVIVAEPPDRAPTTGDPGCYTAAEVANLIHKKPKSVYALAAAGHLPSFLLGRSRLFPKAKIDQILNPPTP